MPTSRNDLKAVAEAESLHKGRLFVEGLLKQISGSRMSRCWTASIQLHLILHSLLVDHVEHSLQDHRYPKIKEEVILSMQPKRNAQWITRERPENSQSAVSSGLKSPVKLKVLVHAWRQTLEFCDQLDRLPDILQQLRISVWSWRYNLRHILNLRWGVPMDDDGEVWRCIRVGAYMRRQR